jgi:hypothetical protein
MLVTLFTLFFRRACALEGLGVTAAIVRGFQVIFGNLKDVVALESASAEPVSEAKTLLAKV